MALAKVVEQLPHLSGVMPNALLSVRQNRLALGCFSCDKFDALPQPSVLLNGAVFPAVTALGMHPSAAACASRRILVLIHGFEPRTSCLQGRRSNRTELYQRYLLTLHTGHQSP